ncbi:MAG: type II secretion system F family protein [Chloroflexi bacterium]|nr:type II secretion system F family protein [Chloroflexota bacterium]MCI0783917.1 type II secretion system F family protein [Chloroflexota bacterium]MCI0817155.1 type II secretion system F family protein [Chloroflexota bacterium]MCI0831130.1 type II secretion system F family protein [Chloroflexota bacterium]MCI0838114.1 type II secretion system F family protein [Chloroflexota bacterium]
MLILLIVVALSGLFACLAVAIFGRQRTSIMETRIEAFRVRTTTQTAGEDVDLEMSFGRRVVKPAIEGLTRTATGVLPQSVLADIQQQLTMARSPMKVSTFVTIWLSSLVVFCALGLMVFFTVGSLPSLAVGFVLLVLGYKLPRMWLKSRVNAKQKQVILSLPDNLDLITTCVEAGLGLDAALSRVAEQSEGPLSVELQRMLREVSMGKLRREAMQEMADRVGVEELSYFITSIIQAEKLGVGIAQVLRVQSDQLRMQRRQRAERLANEAPIKMIFPLVLLIFPAFLAVILAPAVIRISETF